MNEPGNPKGRFSISDRLRSFRNAFRGVALLVAYEHNFRIHLVILSLAIIAGITLHISAAEWIFVALASGLVLTTESINTAIENLSDEVSPEKSSRIGKAKDVAAAGVLIASCIAAVVGLIIFLPRIIGLFNR